MSEHVSKALKTWHEHCLSSLVRFHDMKLRKSDLQSARFYSFLIWHKEGSSLLIMRSVVSKMKWETVSWNYRKIHHSLSHALYSLLIIFFFFLLLLPYLQLVAQKNLRIFYYRTILFNIQKKEWVLIKNISLHAMQWGRMEKEKLFSWSDNEENASEI